MKTAPYHLRMVNNQMPFKFLVYETPLGNLNLDLEGKYFLFHCIIILVISDLHKTGLFSYMSSEVDEVEHSIELHLPFIRISSDRNDLKIVPILCGHVPKTKQHKYGKVFSHYLQDPECFFIISSDFCHW